MCSVKAMLPQATTYNGLFLRDEEMNQNERSNTLAQLSGDPLAAKAN
jgi:hypothetical protein